VITDSVSEAAEESVISVIDVIFFMMALLSVNLGVINMIPFPALDGGRTLMCLFEGLFRRPVPERIEYAINFAGMCLLMVLLVVTLFNDIFKLFNGTFFG